MMLVVFIAAGIAFGVLGKFFTKFCNFSISWGLCHGKAHNKACRKPGSMGISFFTHAPLNDMSHFLMPHLIEKLQNSDQRKGY